MAPGAIEYDALPQASDELQSFGGDNPLEMTWDVIVAGAGPVGLFTACELALKGVSVLVLERDTKAQAPEWRQQALGQRNLFVPAIEALYRRNLLEQVFPNHATRPLHVPEKTKGFQMAGHFAGMMINGNNVDYSRWEGLHLPGPACVPDTCIIGHVENVLTTRALELGVQIVRGNAVTDLKDEGDHVMVSVGNRQIRAGWIVGCDGGRSSVRKAAGIELHGTEAEFTGYAVQCTLSQPHSLKPGFCRTPNGLYIVHGPLVWVLDHGTTFDRSQAVTKEHFQEVLRRVSETNITVDQIQHALSFSDRCKQATQYRKGRVLLAGDSAHIHPPFGAQGLNTGIADAMNLGWKLAATVKGYAAPGLIDTYHKERHPEAVSVLNWVRAQIVTLRPGQMGEAAAGLIRDFNNTVDGATHSVGYVWGLSQRYDIGKDHVLVGRSVPDMELANGQRIGPLLADGNFVLVDFDGRDSIAEFTRMLRPSVLYARSSSLENHGCKALLIRCDGIVVWAPTESIDEAALNFALSCWITPSTTSTKPSDADLKLKELAGVPSAAGKSFIPTPVTIQAVIGRSLDKEQTHNVLGIDVEGAEGVKIAT